MDAAGVLDENPPRQVVMVTVEGGVALDAVIAVVDTEALVDEALVIEVLVIEVFVIEVLVIEVLVIDESTGIDIVMFWLAHSGLRITLNKTA